MEAMTAVQPPEYVLARSVLLDALQALAPHLDAGFSLALEPFTCTLATLS